MPWACDRCGTIHTQNPAECRNCGHRILEPVSSDDVRRNSEGISAPDSTDLDDDQVMGTASDPEYDSSPDVTVDGSLEKTESDRETGPRRSDSSSLWSLYNYVRAILLAPVGLLREYIVPILAFLLVTVAVLALLGLVP